MVAEEVGPWDGPIVRENLARHKRGHLGAMDNDQPGKSMVIVDTPKRVAETQSRFSNRKIAADPKAERKAVGKDSMTQGVCIMPI